MATELDDRLRAGLHRLADEPVPPVEQVEADVRRRVARRRGRRRAAATLTAALVAAAGVGVVVASLTGPDTVTSDAPTDGVAAPAPALPVSITGIDAAFGPEGTERVVVHFDGPVPLDPVAYVPDITQPDAPGLAYTTQGPSELHVCGDRHWFPGDRGSVDVLIPESWLAAGTSVDDVPIDWSQSGELGPGKIPGCGPYLGYVQFSIWGPASDDPADVRAYVAGGGTDLVIEISPR